MPLRQTTFPGIRPLSGGRDPGIEDSAAPSQDASLAQQSTSGVCPDSCSCSMGCSPFLLRRGNPPQLPLRAMRPVPELRTTILTSLIGMLDTSSGMSTSVLATMAVSLFTIRPRQFTNLPLLLRVVPHRKHLFLRFLVSRLHNMTISA